MRYKKQLDELKGISLAGLQDIDMASALYFTIFDITANRKDCVSSIIRILVALFTRSIEEKAYDDCEDAFVFSNSYKNRRDHNEAFDRLTGLFKSKVVIKPGRIKLQFENIKYIKRGIQWFWNLKSVLSFGKSLYYTSMIMFGVTNAIHIVRIILNNKCKKVIVFSDMHLIDSLVVQMCNNKSIPTITLQHGNYELDEPFVLSKSSYFLAYGEYTKNKAIKYGMDSKRIKEAGILKLIGKEIPQKMKEGNEPVTRIGILLSGYAFADSDARMVNIVTAFCKKNGIKVFVKLHPKYGTNNYKSVKWETVDHIYDSEITSEEFKEYIDVAIILNSTVFMEYTMMLFPTFLFVDEKDTFIPEISWCKFYDENDLKKLISYYENEKDEMEKRIIESRAFFSASGNITENYRRFINEIN